MMYRCNIEINVWDHLGGWVEWKRNGLTGTRTLEFKGKVEEDKPTKKN